MKRWLWQIETQVDRILKQNWNGTISDTLDELVHYLDGELILIWFHCRRD